jgi:hypothetical protein
MNHSIKLIEASGRQMISSKTILEHDCVSLKNEGSSLEFTIAYGLNGHLGKMLDEQLSYFNQFNDLYLLFSEDDRTFQAVRIVAMSFLKKDRYTYVFKASIVVDPANYFSDIMNYLVRKVEKLIEWNQIEKYHEKLMDTLKEAINRE